MRIRHLEDGKAYAVYGLLTNMAPEGSAALPYFLIWDPYQPVGRSGPGGQVITLGAWKFLPVPECEPEEVQGE